VSDKRRERVARLAVFLLCVVILCIFVGTALSQLKLDLGTARKAAMIATVGCVLISYLAAYRPGWLYRSLAQASKDDSLER
jgi:hypothetical protein